MKPYLLLLLSLGVIMNIKAQPGTLDIAFGDNGQLTTFMSAVNSGANTIAVQSNSKILVAGFAANNGNNDFAIAQYHPDGSLDTNFNQSGKVLVDFNGVYNYCTSMALQTDKKIILAGYTDNGNGFDLAMARLNESGTLDTHFGNEGKVTASIGMNFFANAVAIQPDGKILVAGYSFSFALTNEFAVMRFLPDGNPDLAFGDHGVVMTAARSIGPSIATAMTLQPDGKIILAGHAFNDPLWQWEAAVIRYNTDGTLDDDFGNEGVAITPIPGSNITMNAVALQEDGKIVIAGYNGTSPSNNKFTLIRYLADGTQDNNFANQGVLISAIGPLNNEAKSIIMQEDKILVGGTLRQGNIDHFAIACYNENGSINTAFGDQGIGVTNGPNEGLNAFALQPDGKIIAAGVTLIGSRLGFTLARFHSEASLGIGTDTLDKEDGRISVYPNPVYAASQLQFTLNQNDIVSIYLYDALGRKIKTLLDAQTKTTGTHEEPLNISDTLASGNYFIVMATSQGKKTLKIVK